MGLLAAASVSALALWSYGCSSNDNPSSPGLGKADPGGTFGVQAMVHVTGAGRVLSAPAGIDCPGTCASILLFDPSSAAATTAREVTLSATASAGWRFAGWDFESIDAPGHGRGADPCQPIVRRTNTPSADPSSNVIKLAAGEQDGTPPQGQDCAGVTKVPLAYSVTAKFVRLDAPPDGGSEGTPLYACPAPATGRKLFHKGGRLLWQCDSSGQSTIWSGDTSGAATAAQFASAASIQAFQVDPYASHAVYQTGPSEVYARNTSSGTSAVRALGTVPTTCSALTADGLNGYCRSLDSLFRWPLESSATGSIVATGLPSGSDLTIDGSPATNVYFSESSSSAGGVYFLPVAALDGGAPGRTPVATGQVLPLLGYVSSTTAYWQNGAQSIVSASKAGGGAPATLQSRTTGIRSFVYDPLMARIYFLYAPSTGAGASSIEWVVSGSTVSTVTKSGLTNPVALAVDGSYVYWLSGDGRVFRALK
ncbi:hypothetical protein [Pendulispora albinea]|uniref:Bacterial repeat domain-containing protein n=1 Tax=Pendulispora albinea TaxID=2741071 RepID=A0ABZ2LQV8_9BACT